MTWEALTVDARDRERLARWWAETLGWHITDATADGVEVRPPADTLPALFFTRVDEPAARSKNRLHLDLHAADQAATLETLLARGATRVDVGQPSDAAWVVLRDPEGNEFCLLEPR